MYSFCQVLSVGILSGDDWYPAIIGSKAVVQSLDCLVRCKLKEKKSPCQGPAPPILFMSAVIESINKFLNLDSDPDHSQYLIIYSCFMGRHFLKI